MSSLQLQALGGRPLAVVANEVAMNRWMSAVALAIICYDTILTLPEEVRPASLASAPSPIFSS
ncbi:hypothetical protein CPB86DRAFT_785779, partial [Serendipita vermifera]